MLKNSFQIPYFYSGIMIFRNLLFFIAVLLTIGWILGFFVWKHEGTTIHILIVLAVISLILGLTRKVNDDIG